MRLQTTAWTVPSPAKASVPVVNDEQIKKRWMAIPYIHLLQAFILIPGAPVPGMPYRVRLNSIEAGHSAPCWRVPDGSSIAIGRHEEGGA